MLGYPLWNEVALTFELSLPDANALESLPWLMELEEGPPGREKFRSVYFDSGKKELREKGLSLHLVRAGENWVQTIEAVRPGAGKWLTSKKCETVLKGWRPELRHARKTVLEPLARKKLERNLKPVFEAEIQRTLLPIYWRDEHVELTIDRGQIRRGNRSEPISRIEIKQKGDAPSELAAFVTRLSRDLSIRWAGKSDAERGYEIGQNRQEKFAGAEEIALERKATTQDSFKTIGLSCLHHLMLNEGAVQSGDAEGIHQMRVALRRLRAGVSLYKDILGDPQSEDVKAQLKWLTGQLGPARDMDVFVKETVDPLRQSQPPRPKRKLATLEAILKERRSAGFEKARGAVQSERYRKIMLETGLWLEAGGWMQDPDPQRQAERQRTAKAFSRDVLTTRTNKIVRKVKKLDQFDVAQRHKLRIAVKKLRYATEFYESLFPGKKANRQCKAFRKSLKDLQGALGKLNDIAVHERLADEIAPPSGAKAARKAAFAMGFVTGQERGQIAPLVSDAIKAGRRLKKLPGFWK